MKGRERVGMIAKIVAIIHSNIVHNTRQIDCYDTINFERY